MQGPSDKENVIPKAAKPTLVLMELILVIEETESDQEVREVSDEIDNEVRWKIFRQRCWTKRKQTHPYAGGHRGFPQLGAEINLQRNTRRVIVMDMVIFRTIFFELLVFFTFMLLTLHFAY